jgi:uncharacterized protein (DUF58 family)
MFAFGNKEDKTSNETSSLLPSSASGNTSSYYFLPKTEAEGGVHSSVRDADGLAVTESVPAGSTEAEFAPRPIGLKVRFHNSYLLFIVHVTLSFWESESESQEIFSRTHLKFE